MHHTGTTRSRTVPVAITAAVLCLAALALFWPGIAMYDSVGQFGQVLDGEYADWHPPILARLWAVLHAGVGGAGGPMLVVQMASYWTGFGLIAAGLARIGRTRTAVVTLAIGAMPLFLGWQGVLLKDTQMLGAVLASVGLVAWWRLRGTRVPVAALVVVTVLLGYATLVRANAVFGVMPLVVMLFGPRRWWLRGVTTLVAVGAVLAVAPAINHGLLGAEPSGVERTEPLYDLAGIAVRVPAAPVGLTPAEARALIARHCVKPLFWDPLGTPERCEPIVARLHEVPAGRLYGLLAEGAVRHPLAYAAHRLAHLNSTERWLVPFGWPGAAPPAGSEPNSLGLASPGAVAGYWQAVARGIAATPLGWPIAWVVVALTALAVALGRAASPPRDLALALLVSALALEESFGAISIASDLRYHLWPMVATALASVLLADAAWPRRTLVAGGVVLAMVVTGGLVARATLPPAPPSYQAQLE